MSPGAVNFLCLVCEDSANCFGQCQGLPAGEPVGACFRPAVNRPGDLDPLTGSAQETIGSAVMVPIPLATGPVLIEPISTAVPDDTEFSPFAAAGPADASPTVPPARFLGPELFCGAADRRLGLAPVCSPFLEIAG